MDSSRAIGLYFDSALPSSSLLAFPIVLQDTGDGKKQITPQYRIQRLDSWTDSKEDSVFITTYGFIFQVGNEEVTVGMINDNPGHELLSSAMLCLGSVPNDGDLVELARACLTMVVTCKKSATNTERIVFSVVQAPRVLQSCMVVANRYSSVNAVNHVKAPEKIPGSGTLEYKVNFVSLTVVPRKDVYRIPTAALKSIWLKPVQSCAQCHYDCGGGPEEPVSQIPFQVDSWILCNSFLAYRGMVHCRKEGKESDIDQARGEDKETQSICRAQDCARTFRACEGERCTDKAVGTFLLSQWDSLLSYSKCLSPGGKILWSQTAHLRSVKIVIQAGTQRAVAVTADHEVTSTKIEKRHTIAKYNPFKK
uniref:Matrix protein n=1 Tax=Avian paramyxovirus 1 TaxID=2560319 RepID=Q9WBL3_NCDV|nr:matrix protein [avian paramyxovirus 1]